MESSWLCSITSDKHCDQGGYAHTTTDGIGTISLKKAYKNTKYNLLITSGVRNDETDWSIFSKFVTAANSFSVWSKVTGYNLYFYWRAYGVIA